MALARFDPWQYLRPAQVNANPAYPAYRAGDLGRVGTLGAGDPSLIGDFEERSAILEVNSGLTREEAEAVAAHALGLGTPSVLRAVAIECWRARLSLPMCRSDARGLVEDAQALVNGRWINPLVALGWDEISLFGCEPTGLHPAGLVSAVRRQPIVAATSASVRYLDPHGRARHHYRFGRGGEQVILIWELPDVPNDPEHARTMASLEISSMRNGP